LYEAHQGLPNRLFLGRRLPEGAMSRRAAAPDAGFSVVLAVFSILLLVTLGIAMVSIVVEDSDLSVAHVQENQAFYAAHAGLEYALAKLAANWSWGGLPSPGKNVGAGSFWIAPPDAVDENGNPLPAGRKRVISTGVVAGTKREIQVQVTGGLISTHAGTGAAGYSGDVGAATSAQLRHPEGVAVASNGDVYFADTDNNVVRKVTFASGVITTVAGTGSPGSSGRGAAEPAAGNPSCLERRSLHRGCAEQRDPKGRGRDRDHHYLRGHRRGGLFRRRRGGDIGPAQRPGGGSPELGRGPLHRRHRQQSDPTRVPGRNE